MAHRRISRITHPTHLIITLLRRIYSVCHLFLVIRRLSLFLRHILMICLMVRLHGTLMSRTRGRRIEAEGVDTIEADTEVIITVLLRITRRHVINITLTHRRVMYHLILRIKHPNLQMPSLSNAPDAAIPSVQCVRLKPLLLWAQDDPDDLHTVYTRLRHHH